VHPEKKDVESVASAMSDTSLAREFIAGFSCLARAHNPLLGDERRVPE